MFVTALGVSLVEIAPSVENEVLPRQGRGMLGAEVAHGFARRPSTDARLGMETFLWPTVPFFPVTSTRVSPKAFFKSPQSSRLRAVPASGGKRRDGRAAPKPGPPKRRPRSPDTPIRAAAAAGAPHAAAELEAKGRNS